MKLWSILKEKNKKRHFCDVDTAIFNAQLKNGSLLALMAKTTQPTYSIPERQELIYLIFTEVDLTEEEEHRRCMACI